MLDWIQSNPFIVVSAAILCIVVLGLFFFRSRRTDKESPEEHNEQKAAVISGTESAINNSKQKEKGGRDSSIPQSEKISGKSAIKADDLPQLPLVDGLSERTPANKQAKSEIKPAKPAEKPFEDNTDFQIPGELDLLFMENAEVLLESDTSEAEASREEITEDAAPPSSSPKKERYITDMDLQFLDLEDSGK